MNAAMSEPRRTLRTVTPRLGRGTSPDGAAAWSRRRRVVSSRTSGTASEGTDCAAGNPARSGGAIHGLKSAGKTRQPMPVRWKIMGVNHHFFHVCAVLAVAAGALAAPPTSQPASAPAPASNLGPNLISNGDFEHSMDGWDNAKDNGMSLVSPEAAHSGG